jgi:LPS-assembly lipoprotein
MVAMLGLAGCGFQPLYGKTESLGGGDAGPALASVHILPIADRTGQNLYNELRDRMNPQGVPPEAQYDLVVKIAERTTQPLILQDQTAVRIDLTLLASYWLYQRGNRNPIMHGTSQATTSYDYLNNPFATVVSEDDAHRRGAQSLADDIANRLAVYLARPEG